MRLHIKIWFGLLPTTYGVWGKVMFSQACVILFTGGGYLQEHRPDASPLDALPSGCTLPFQWMNPPRQKTDVQQAVGTHPTGIHTCFIFYTWRFWSGRFLGTGGVPTRTGKPGKIGRHFLVHFEQTGIVVENHAKYWNFRQMLFIFLVIFKWTVYYLQQWLKFSV